MEVSISQSDRSVCCCCQSFWISEISDWGNVSYSAMVLVRAKVESAGYNPSLCLYPPNLLCGAEAMVLVRAKVESAGYNPSLCL